jgi:hypothetical protein
MATHFTEATRGIPGFTAILDSTAVRPLTFNPEHVPAPSAALTTAAMYEDFPLEGSPALEADPTQADSAVVVSMGEAAASTEAVVADIGERVYLCMNS